MSDSDDTDVLLLIPPDFFLVYSDSEESYYDKSHEHCASQRSVVEHLVSHVCRLENRVNRIEVNSTEVSLSLDSCNSTIIDMGDNHQYRKTDFRLRSNEAQVNPSSTRSTPQKPKTRLTISSLPSTPSSEKPSHSYKYKRHNPPIRVSHNQSTDADESSFTTTPERKQNKKILGEIDQFLSNVKTIQLLSSKKSPITFDEPTITLDDLKTGIEETSKTINSLNLEDVDKLLQSMETQQRIMDTSAESQDRRWQCGDQIGSIPDLGFGLRETKQINEIVQSDSSESITHTVLERHPEDTPKTNPRSVQKSRQQLHQTKSESMPHPEDVPKINLPSVQKSRQLQQTESEDIPKINNHSSVQKFRQQLHQTQTGGESSMSAVNLFSLADIWNTHGGHDVILSEKEMKKLLPRLEEEKCRRKHCEKLIQDLQMKILEMQQRLAVAVQVDSAKDEAILKFHEAWEKVAHRWQSLESERNTLSNRLYAAEEQSNVEVADAAQKVSQYELELSKASELARINQDKYNNMESERTSLMSQLDNLRSEVMTTHDNLKIIATQRNELATQISNMEKDSLQDKKILLDTQNELAQSKNVFLQCQTELFGLKEEHAKLQKKIKTEQTSMVQLETQKKNLQMSLETVRTNESTLHSEMKKMQENMDRNKIELRSFYQQQVEVLVNDKLKEFQGQLELAEKSLQNELQVKEQTIVRSAAKQLHKLTDKHRLEVQLLEAKHTEEMRLYDLQFTKMQQQNQMLQNKIESYQARRSNIAKELHNIMENQWLEALKIINNGRSPMAEKSAAEPEPPQKELTLADLKRLIANEQQSEEPPTQEKQCETPVSSKVDHPSETQLQSYMQKLLEKVNHAATEKTVSESVESCDSLDMIPWHQLISAKIKERSGKPPWK